MEHYNKKFEEILREEGMHLTKEGYINYESFGAAFSDEEEIKIMKNKTKTLKN
ncbi:MAG: hypothetical protein ABIG69_19325 [Bacteroidota bacterium]